MGDEANQESQKKYLRPNEVAEILRVSPKTLANWRSLGKGPDWHRHGGLVVYPSAGLDTFPST